MKLFLYSLNIPDKSMEYSWLFGLGGDPEHKASKTKVYSTAYPFALFTRFFECPTFEFEPITVFYGGNGSGKSTLLNVIAEKLSMTRNSPFNKTDFFADYCNLCFADYDSIPYESKIITSDDIFKKMNSVRVSNNQNDDKRSKIMDNWHSFRNDSFSNPELLRFNGFDDYDRWYQYAEARGKTSSNYINDRLQKNMWAGSNGETAIIHLTDEIQDNALYLLDEPENSLSPKLQLELKTFLEDSARFFNCQFIIATHSPLLLGMKNAKIYNLDDDYADVYKWTELENVKVYAEFFKEHLHEF